MQFRLTYGGMLKSTGNRSDAAHVHQIRRVFHAQLRKFWLSHPYLKDALWSDAITGRHVPTKLLRDKVAEEWARFDGYNFVPLVTESLSLACGLDVLFLRPSMPGEIMKSGDIDGRMKTIFDALRMPESKSELGGYDEPLEDESPFYVLLQDDKLISHISIATDILLEPTRAYAGPNDARLVISVSIKPVNTGWHNINFGGA